MTARIGKKYFQAEELALPEAQSGLGWARLEVGTRDREEIAGSRRERRKLDFSTVCHACYLHGRW